MRREPCTACPNGQRCREASQCRIARAAHERGRMRLASLFGVHPDDDSPPRVWAVLLSPLFKAAFDQTPVRTKPGTPPLRDPEHRRKHRLRKIAHKSRRRNRA